MTIPNPYGSLGPAPDPSWLDALNARSRGLNRLLGLPKRKTTGTRPRSSGAAAAAAAPFDPYAAANEGVQSIIDAMLAQVDREQQAAYQRAQQDAALAYQKGQALAEGLKALGISGNVQKAFTDAAQSQAGLAQGFSGQIRDQAAAQAAEQQRALAGTGQEGAVRNQGENMGNVQYGVGGYFPSTALNTMGAAFGADAALQPGFALQFGAIDQANRMNDYARNELPDFLNKRLDVIGQRPQLMNDLLQQNLSIDDRLYQRKIDQRDYATKQAAAKAQAQQDRIDRQMEAIALKMSYGMKLTARDKKLIATYGLSSQTANTLIRGQQDQAAQQAKAALQAAKDRAAMARQKFQAAQQAAREARAQAARSRLEADKAKARAALEAQKAAYRIWQDAIKGVNAAAKKAAKSKTVGNAGDSAQASGSGAAGYFGG